MPRTTRAASPHVSLLVDGSRKVENGGTRLERVFVEQDGKIVPVNVSGTWSLASRRIASWKPSQVAVRICVGSPASWAWVRLEHGEPVLVVRQVTDRVGECQR